MPRYRVGATGPSMLSLPNTTVTMNHVDDLRDAEATALNMNRKKKNQCRSSRTGRLGVRLV